MNRLYKAIFLILGWALLATRPGAAAQPKAQVSWEPIEAGLMQLAGGDGNGAADTFVRAIRSGDASGLAELLMDLTEVYIAYRVSPEEDSARTLEVQARLEVARQFFYRRQITPAVLGDALTRIRQLLKRAPVTESSPSLLRPLLCNLRLLSGDRATDGEAVLEHSGQSRDLGPLKLQRPVFQPLPSVTEDAREAKIKDSVAVELTLDSEGCPASEKLLKPLSRGLAEQTLSTLRWWAFEPTRYNGIAVGWKLNVVIRFVIF
jgi:hypothetical protein